MRMQSHCGNTDLKKCNIVNISKKHWQQDKTDTEFGFNSQIIREGIWNRYENLDMKKFLLRELSAFSKTLNCDCDGESRFLMSDTVKAST